MIDSRFYIKYILAIIIAIALVIAIIFGIKKIKNYSEASIDSSEIDNTKYGLQISVDKVVIQPQNKSKLVNLDNIIADNEQDVITEKIERREQDVEFTTEYRNNNSLVKGKIQTIQEGSDGKEDAIVKNIYKNGELVSSENFSSEIKKASVNKIVEIGTAQYANNYVPVPGDKLQATSIELAIRVNPSKDADKLITIKKGEIFILKAKQDDWYYVIYGNYQGWIPSDCATYYDPNGNGDGDENNQQYTKEQLTQNLGFSMLINKKSGLSLSQFKKVLSNDANDKNSIFSDNAEYFYYAEQQYNINGIFIAAMGIHESAWGTSEISKTKKNLFGYGAYDRDPSGSAATFNNYSEGIDLVSRVLVKYYVNQNGTPIYGGETAQGTYYKGATISAVNKSYASDTHWANAVYKWMMYLYNKL